MSLTHPADYSRGTLQRQSAYRRRRCIPQTSSTRLSATFSFDTPLSLSSSSRGISRGTTRYYRFSLFSYTNRLVATDLSLPIISKETRLLRNFLLSIFTRDKLRSALRERHAAERKIPLGGRRRGEEDRERTRDEKREANPLGAGSSSAAAATSSSSSSFSFSPLRRRATKPQEGPKVSRDNDRSLKYAPRQFADQNYY